MTIDTPAAIDRLLRFLSVEGITGEEAAIGKEIATALKEVGVPAAAIRYDDANTRIPAPTQTGNLIVDLPGTTDAPRILFMTHMDTVPLCAGAKPKRAENRIVNENPKAALGGDNRTGCAALVTLAAELIRQNLPHPPITMFFTVREESGLFGAKHVQPAELGGPKFGFNIDGRSASEITIGAIGADRWEVEIFGKASHAGVHPEKGISASMVASLALADVFANGWFGKVEKNGKQGTSNVGSFGDAAGKSAGNATNVVTDYVLIRGESRSHDAKFVRDITAAYKLAFEAAAKKVKDHKDKPAKVKFTSRLDYVPFRLPDDAAVVKRAVAVAKSMKLKPSTKVTNGGLDANWMVKHGIPTITFGAGQNEIHTVNEFVDLKDYEAGCRLALALATME
ncbi:M20/M25/M40 family metallo-hydrolase [Limnoglobus roseus]|uniref:M20/M25/M40 family metallo-hydrolase n=1 Tax=Limnoglobus roseus TaxID=2598579 RepID=UPI00143CE951